jgi:hypothetical protein
MSSAHHRRTSSEYEDSRIPLVCGDGTTRQPGCDIAFLDLVRVDGTKSETETYIGNFDLATQCWALTEEQSGFECNERQSSLRFPDMRAGTPGQAVET